MGTGAQPGPGAFDADTDLRAAIARTAPRRPPEGAGAISSAAVCRGNLPRVLPDATVAMLQPDWPVPPVFGWLARAGDVPVEEMLRVFNCGVGMALVVATGDADSATTLLTGEGETVYRSLACGQIRGR